jgi:hypothetical protein
MTYLEREFIRIRALKLGQLNLNSTDYPIGDNIHGPASPVRGADGGFQAKERRSRIHKTMLKNNHGTPSVSDLLIDSVGFNLKQITDRSYQIFDPQFTEEKRQLSILLDVDLNVIYPHLLTVRKEAYDIIGEEYVFIRPYRVGHTSMEN